MGASPQGVDWNNDQKVDLLTGEKEGYVRIYLNVGTAEAPAFDGFTYLQLGGADFDCGDTSKPDVVDWDNDGRKDLLVGTDDGHVLLLLNTGTDAAPEFQASTPIQAGEQERLIFGGRASPVAIDWNRDGKKDLIVGETLGTLFYFPNVGTDAAPVFTGYEQLMAGGQTINVVMYSRPEAVDWDSDGVMDLLCGSYDSLALPTSPVWYFHSDPGPVQLTTPASVVAVDRGQDYTVEWSGGNAENALALWQCGPIGWQQVAAEVSANDQQHLWATAGEPQGWYAVSSFVRTGQTWSPDPLLSPGWVKVADAAPPPAPLAAAAAAQWVPPDKEPADDFPAADELTATATPGENAGAWAIEEITKTTKTTEIPTTTRSQGEQKASSGDLCDHSDLRDFEPAWPDADQDDALLSV